MLETIGVEVSAQRVGDSVEAVLYRVGGENGQLAF
jgi:hypothetical protein